MMDAFLKFWPSNGAVKQVFTPLLKMARSLPGTIRSIGSTKLSGKGRRSASLSPAILFAQKTLLKKFLAAIVWHAARERLISIPRR